MAPTLWAISDLHTGHSGNKPITESLYPANPADWLIVAGDVAERTDDIRWRDRGDVRRIGLDFHGVIQVKHDRGGWCIPALHLELIRALQDLNWRVLVISWVGRSLFWLLWWCLLFLSIIGVQTLLSVLEQTN